MKNITIYLSTISMLVLFNACSDNDNTLKTSQNIIEVVSNSYTHISSYGQNTKYNQIDTNGSLIDGILYETNATPFSSFDDQATQIDFNQSDVALFRIIYSGAEDKMYYVTKITEFDSYVEIAGEEWLSITGGSEVMSYPGAWVKIPKYDKPVMYNEHIQYIDYETPEQRYENNPTKTDPKQGNAIAFSLLAEGNVEVSGRIGKHYELVRSANRLELLYEKAGISTEIAQEVDFSTHHVLAFFMGSVDSAKATISLRALNYIKNEYSNTGADFKTAKVDNAISPSPCVGGKNYLPYQFVSIPSTSYVRDDIAFVDIVHAVECQ